MQRIIRPMTPEEIPQALDWAAEEGWNPGLDDAAPFAVTDPEGFVLCLVDDRPAACISVVRYDDSFGFLGFYIAHPDFRGQGHGWATWQAGMAHLGARTIGLDGVVDQQANYAKSGFTYAHRNVRYGGVPQALDTPSIETVELAAVPLAQLSTFDRSCFPADRDAFLELWRQGPSRTGRALIEDGALQGYGVIRSCRNGHKLGPVFARSEPVARALIRDLLADRTPKEEIFLDPPEPNGAAVAIANELGLSPVFETARMYRGTAPELPLTSIYGISTFELG